MQLLIYLLVSSVDKLCQQVAPRSGHYETFADLPHNCWSANGIFERRQKTCKRVENCLQKLSAEHTQQSYM